ncbi:MAG: LuxR C-terminal-related transcriptional regulator, partial [Solirubrobacteraceae bacterium]
LSEAGVAELVRARFPAADPELSAACGRVTLGNPLLVCELIDALDRDECAPTAQTAARLGEIIPERLRFAVAAALQSAGADARRVAHGVAVLGDGASVRHVAALTGLDSAAVLDGAGALASIDLLGAGLPLAFAQPLLGAAVLASLSPFEQAAAHLAAARILAERHADPREIAGHLLRGHADDDPTAIAPLRAAAAMALRDGAPASAVALLERALAEAPAAEQRVELLAELGEAQARAGDPGAGARLAEARRLSTDPRRRAELALAEGRAHYATGRFADAAEVLASAACELGDAEPQLGADLTATYLCSAAMVSDLHGPVVALRERLLSAISGPPTALQRAAIAHTAVHDSLLGAPRAQVRRLATLAWGDGALLHANGGLELGAPLLCAALVVADELELAIEIGDAVLTASDAERLSLAEEFVSCVRAWALYQQGRIAEAEADASAALDSPLTAGTSFAHCARAVIASCHIERGQLDHAEAVLAAHDRHVLVPPIWQALLLHTRALLRLAERHPQEALADALQAGAAIDAHYPHSSPGAIPWRSTAALAHLALGEPRPARALIKDELARAHKLGLTRMAIRNLRILGLALNGQGLEKLAQAVEAGDAYPARLEHIRALVDYGAALRRRNRRADAREPLRRGLDLSHRGGAGMLESRAQTELTAAGARPRRPAASGVDSLTVSQRPVAELAASGLTTRQIAEALFVTPKTVEFHLRQTYLKLDVTSREGLTEALTAG